jgi:dihydroxyacid dehydratase/phosphogluconate dehydratase
MRRAQWSALGLTDEDLEKPKIAIVNSSSQLASCFSHLDEIVAPLKAAIEAAGGVAFEVRTAAPSDAITGRCPGSSTAASWWPRWPRRARRAARSAWSATAT